MVMKRLKNRLSLAAAGLLSLGLAACAYNEELGRNQLLFGASPQQMAQAASGAWNDIKRQQRVSNDPRYTSRLNRVAPKIIRAAGGNPAEWEYLVFASDDLNAFALPGGKIGIYTGIMDIMENDAQLAAVVGHEVGHVNYRHAAERSSQGMLAQLGLAAGTIAGASQCSGSQSAAERQSCEQRAGMMVQAFGLGAVYGAILPYSRTHELEADSGGLRYMVQAGYNPCEAMDFWRNMANASAGQARPPEFLSTHPASDTRIDNLRADARRLGYQCR